jgi:hypothetical protein
MKKSLMLLTLGGLLSLVHLSVVKACPCSAAGKASAAGNKCSPGCICSHQGGKAEGTKTNATKMAPEKLAPPKST